ncbi:hypothetical protein [Ahrensia marina]|uniref:Uncharacterized protein n=1 Tax=Ahrensia marina TaxID=1514904 RepID=A0A0M9GQA4_9HYPH|nr:hypothetical protein [Ahrensia marina]KPB02919.1 hypothetical protein SU32_01235 [Ahrensia marina]
MSKAPKKLKSDKSNEGTIPFLHLTGLVPTWVDLKIMTDKKGKLKRTKVTWPNGDWMWTNYDKDGKPATGTGGGKGWDMEWEITYDKKGRKKSAKTITTRGRKVTVMTQKFDPKTGEMIDQRTKVYLDGLH